MLEFEPHSKVTLLYANTKEENIIFKKELNQLAHQYPQFQYIDFISGEKQISKTDLAIDSNASYYICGPDSLKEEIIQQLKALKISKSNIHMEHFTDRYMPWFGIFINRKHCFE